MGCLRHQPPSEFVSVHRSSRAVKVRWMIDNHDLWKHLRRDQWPYLTKAEWTDWYAVADLLKKAGLYAAATQVKYIALSGLIDEALAISDLEMEHNEERRGYVPFDKEKSWLYEDPQEDDYYEEDYYD